MPRRAKEAEYDRRDRERHPERITKNNRDYYLLRKSALATYKLERGCADCGYNKDPRALEFDHVHGLRPERRVNPMLNWTALFEELELVEVVCANCHRIRTDERGQKRGGGYYAAES